MVCVQRGVLTEEQQKAREDGTLFQMLQKQKMIASVASAFGRSTLSSWHSL